MTIQEIGHILSGRGTDETAKSVFFTLRLPRTVMAFIAGAGLSMAGSIYQDIFRNPLAAPDLIESRAAPEQVRLLQLYVSGKMQERLWAVRLQAA